MGMRILLTGITGFRNRGVEASALPTIAALRALPGAADVTILTEDPDYDRSRLADVPATVVRDRVSVSRTALGRVRHFVSALYPPIRIEYRRAVDAVRSASMVIASGGDLFTSSYGPIQRHLRPLEIALRHRVPVTFLAQSVGPFVTKREHDAWIEVARRASLITVRESLSFKYVTEALGLPRGLVELTADPAFLLPGPPADVTARLLQACRLSDTRPVIAAAVSQGIAAYAGHDHARHAQAWSNAIRLLRDQLGAQILLVPHVQERHRNNDDRALAAGIRHMLGSPDDVRIAGADHSATEFKGLLGVCDMVVAERMHAAIAALSSGVCTVTIGYSTKAEGIVTDLLPDRDPVRRPFMAIGDFLDPKVASRVLLGAWQDRDAISHALRRVLPDVQRKAARNFSLIGDILCSTAHRPDDHDRNPP